MIIHWAVEVFAKVFENVFERFLFRRLESTLCTPVLVACTCVTVKVLGIKASGGGGLITRKWMLCWGGC